MKTKIMSKHAFFCLVVVLLLGSFIGQASAAVYYVRPDGGTAAQCSGLTDAPFFCLLYNSSFISGSRNA